MAAPSDIKKMVAANLRSVTQSCKGGVPLDILERDYKSLLGVPIPYKSLGYSSLEEMLRDMPDVVRLQRNAFGKCVVMAVADESTAHIASLISRQKAVTRRPNSKFRPFRAIRRAPISSQKYPLRQFNRGTRASPVPHYETSFHTNYANSQNNEILKNRSEQISWEQAIERNRTKKASWDHNTDASRIQNNEVTRTQNNEVSRNRIKDDSWDQNNDVARNQNIDASRNLNQEASRFYSAPRSSSVPNADIPQNSKAKVVPPPTFGPKYVVPPRFLRKQERPLTSLENNTTNITEPLNSYPNRSTQPSISPKKSSSTFDSEDEGYVPPPVYKPAPPPVPPPTYTDKSRSAREFVQNYALRKNLKFNYKTTTIGQKRKEFVSHLTLGDKNYRTYPDVKPTKDLAEEAAAVLAKQDINQSEDSQKSIPVTPIDDPKSLELLLTRIDQIVAEKSNGIFNSSIPSEYEEKYSEMLPKEWFTLVLKHCSFYFTEVPDGRYILYPSADSGRASPASSSSNVDDDSTYDDLERKFSNFGITVPNLELPPDGKLFDVFVCNVQDVECIAVRLLDYVDRFAELSEKMKRVYDQNQYPVTTITTEKPYAVLVDELWHRALVEEIKDDKVTCQLVDEGDFIENVNITNLQELDKDFLKLPFQAVNYKLALLEPYSEVIEYETLKEHLLGKPLVAQVVNSSRNSIILYDTETDEDVNVNHTIFKKLVSHTLKYTLPECGASAVGYLCHVSSDGTIYLTFNSPLLSNLLLEELLRITPICEVRAQQDMEVSENSIYCAKYDSDPIWYRAQILQVDNLKKEVEVLYVDYGNTSWVSMSSLCELKPISCLLADLPFQAVKCKLSGLPPPNNFWNEQVSSRLKELAPYDKELIVLVQKPAEDKDVAEVQLSIRNENQEFVSINQTLAFNERLFRLV